MTLQRTQGGAEYTRNLVCDTVKKLCSKKVPHHTKSAGHILPQNQIDIKRNHVRQSQELNQWTITCVSQAVHKCSINDAGECVIKEPRALFNDPDAWISSVYLVQAITACSQTHHISIDIEVDCKNPDTNFVKFTERYQNLSKIEPATSQLAIDSAFHGEKQKTSMFVCSSWDVYITFHVL